MTSRETPELPPLSEAHLDEAALSDLFRDIELVARLRELRLKGRAAAHSQTGELDLEACRRALVRGEVSGVQLVYEHGGKTWIDTLLRTRAGFTLVRVESRVPEQ